jgi:hypothetical protein
VCEWTILTCASKIEAANAVRVAFVLLGIHIDVVCVGVLGLIVPTVSSAVSSTVTALDAIKERATMLRTILESGVDGRRNETWH